MRARARAHECVCVRVCVCVRARVLCVRVLVKRGKQVNMPRISSVTMVYSDSDDISRTSSAVSVLSMLTMGLLISCSASLSCDGDCANSRPIQRQQRL